MESAPLEPGNFASLLAIGSVGFIDRPKYASHACANKARGTSKEGAVIHLSGKDGLGIRILFETRENQSFAANLQVERGGGTSWV